MLVGGDFLDGATLALLDSLDPEGAKRSERAGRTCRVYRTISAGDRLVWLQRFREYGPRHDFRYRNDDAFTEELRDRYNELVTDPALRSEPKAIPLEDLPGYACDLDGWDGPF